MKNRGRSKASKLISRRTFINGAFAGSAVMTLGPISGIIAERNQENTGWPSGASKTRIHLIGHAHIDPVWLWPWSEGISVAHSTFRSALDRMNETPDFKFTASSAQLYQWVAENDPAMLEEIKKRVSEGRWNIVGGWWVEPDVNIPSGESMVRQGLYGQLTFEKLFGKKATVAFNPDSFGHTATLPQIIKLQGMENYVFMRPGPHEKNIPAAMFWWESPDGTRVLTYRIPISYNDTRSVRSRTGQVIEQMKDQPFKTYMSYYGAGDHGGGATKENINSIHEIQSEKEAPVVLFSTPELYFEEMRSNESLQFPTVKDDLQHHAVGCYTAESEIKKGNRLSEAALVTAEKIASIGSTVWGFTYPGKELTTAWQRVLFLQFHDSLAGTSVPEHSVTAREGYGFALDTAHQTTYKAVQRLEWQIPSADPASQYMVVFNTHAWDVKSHIGYDFNWDLKNPSLVEDEKGNPLPHQWTAGTTETGSRRRIIVSTPLPAFGYRQIRIRQGASPEVRPAVTISENTMQNEFLSVKFSASGTIGITSRETGREVFFGGDTGCRAVIINDPSDTWSHDIKSFSDEYGSFGNPVINFTEKGPLRATARVRTTFGSSRLTIDWILYAGARHLEADVTLDWHEHLKMLKFSFPVNTYESVATYETPYGFITRRANGDEDPGQRWIDVTGKIDGKTSGLTVINDAKYGYSVNDNVMNISVARSAVYAHHNPRVLDMNTEHIWQDQGMQTFRMLIVPHAETWQKSRISRIAEEFIAPPVVIYQGIHGGSMPRTNSFLRADPENIVITAIKKSESDDDLIIRCIETSGIQTSATLDLTFLKSKWTGNFRPCEIKTLRVNRRTGEIRKTNLLEE